LPRFFFFQGVVQLSGDWPNAASLTGNQRRLWEGAVFALPGLLLMFTFSGAISRRDRHRELGTLNPRLIQYLCLSMNLFAVCSE
jgi:hypothetical protein